ncbi:MAG: bifunctional glutamate N-acetyltransferase/amino-acid acetyltransferase ArgJ [Saccharofermentans sp.]|nr:bifunctional glutamate N-acetyltransferase/amino-acid acetyltransferase ArgJ [Saccharofermentans sp.]
MENELTKSYITMPKGFKANGVSAGMKCSDPANINENDPKSSYLDVGMVYSDTICNVAGVYTSNLVKGHSLVRSIDIIENKGKAKGIIVNSKVANAGVGAIGVEDASKVAECAASILGCDPAEILTASTGVIGTRLPLDKINRVIPSLVEGLSDSEETAHNAEFAMMTTDTVPKEVSAQIELSGGKTVTISGMAKGSGMIHPNLATMICVFTTDCCIDSSSLKKMLQKAVKYTFNRVSVDGDTSVCDMVIVLANGASGVKVTEGTEDYLLVENALCELSEDIARMLASDGEGATKFVEIEVHGAKDEKDAKLIVTSVARSPLCKTAFFGEDANIGRILTAVGYSGASFDPEKVDIRLSGLLMYKDGAAVAFDEDEASRLLAEHDIKVDITLYEGDAYDRMFTCDFSYDYVKINGNYRT